MKNIFILTLLFSSFVAVAVAVVVVAVEEVLLEAAVDLVVVSQSGRQMR